MAPGDWQNFDWTLNKEVAKGPFTSQEGFLVAKSERKRNFLFPVPFFFAYAFNCRGYRRIPVIG